MQIFVFSLAAIFAGVLAQDINSLPQCERSCVTNVVALGPSFDCPAIDNGQSAPDCLCSKEAFAYAIRDCSQESCPSGTDVELVQSYGLEYCQSAQASASGTTLAAIGVFSSGVLEASTTGTGSSSASESSSSREPITTIPIISTITSGSSTEETTLGSTTIFSGETLSTSASANSSETSSSNSTETGAGAGGTSSSAVTTRPVVSTVTDASTTRETTVGSSTEFSSVTGSSSSEGAGATMAPLRIVPAFAARQGNGFSIGAWVMQALGWTVVVVGLVQLMW